MGAFVLFVVFHVYSGSNLTIQEFTSEISCNEALTRFKAVKEEKLFSGFESAWCQPK